MYNFGKIKNIFNTILVEGISKNDSKKKELFKEYVKAIKSDKVLNAQFIVYNNIEKRVDINENKATEFVKANIDILKKFSKKEIIEANTKLAKLLGGTIPEYENEMAQ